MFTAVVNYKDWRDYSAVLRYIWIGVTTYAVLSLIYDVYYYEMRKEALVLNTRDKYIVLISVIVDIGILMFCGIKALKMWKKKKQ